MDSVGKDSVLGFQQNQWVELTDDTRELKSEPGKLVRIKQVGDRTLEIVGSVNPSDFKFKRNSKVRAWDHNHKSPTYFTRGNGEKVNLELIDGALKLEEDVWINLEDGIQIYFKKDDDDATYYHTGQYWTIPARTNDADILWPTTTTTNGSKKPALVHPKGITHHYCRLALLELQENGQWATDVLDCRPLFPPLTDMDNRGCCLRVDPGDDLQLAVNQLIAAGGDVCV